MNLISKNANNLMSKDFNVAKSAAREVVEKKDIEAFKEICDKSEFIFDFIKEKILKNLLNSVDEGNFKNLFAFMNCYCTDFEDFIVLGLVKFANEDLTDEILELLETGTDEQKTYCAGYFTHILDPVALDLLRGNIKSDFQPLQSNCAKALRAFDDRVIYDEMIERLDGDEGVLAADILASYGDESAFEPIYNFMVNSPYAPNISLNLLELKPFTVLIEEGETLKALKIFETIIDATPEILPLDTVLGYEIKYFLGILLNSNDVAVEKVAKLILKSKIKFELISTNENYTFDLDKSYKAEISSIMDLLNSKNEEFYTKCKNSLYGEFETDKGALDVFEVIIELNLSQYGDEIAKKIAATSFAPLICDGVKTLKALGCLNLADKNALVEKLNDPNAIALLESYYD